MHILVKYPTRARPAAFLARLHEWYRSADDPSRTTWLVTYDTDDTTMTEDVLESARTLIKDIRLCCGAHTSKIEAINADIDKVPNWDVVLVISDDMFCRRQGWDSMIRERMKAYYPNGDGCLWFHDGTKQRAICTLPCLGRPYYEQNRFVYHPSYFSFYCDNEQTEVAQSLGKLTFIEQSISSHEHPAWNAGMKPDDLYRRNNRHWKTDQANYQRRKALGFPA